MAATIKVMLSWRWSRCPQFKLDTQSKQNRGDVLIATTLKYVAAKRKQLKSMPAALGGVCV
jgi:hypothetical protein